MKLRTRIVLVMAVIGTLSLNAVAYMQARSMTRYATSGPRTARPEKLGLLARLRVILTGVNVPRPRNASTPADVGLPFATVPLVSRDGVALEAWHIPSGRRNPIILGFPGYAASKSTLLPSARALHDLGYDTLLVDFYGAGGSSGNETSLGYREAEDVAAALRYAREAHPERKVALYGFSMGAGAILRAVAVEGARPDAIILEATFDDLLSTAKNRFRSMTLPATPFAELLLFWGGVQWGFDPFAHNPADYARTVQCPTLILHGEKDVRATPEQAERVVQATGGRAKLVLYAGVPHMLIVEARPAQWKRDVAEFLRGL